MLLIAIGVVIAAIYLLPFYVAIANSFKTDQDASIHPLSLPTTWTAAAFETLFSNSDFGIWAMNSAIVAVCVNGGPDLLRLARRLRARQTQLPRPKAVFAALIAVMAVPDRPAHPEPSSSSNN